MYLEKDQEFIGCVGSRVIPFVKSVNRQRRGESHALLPSMNFLSNFMQLSLNHKTLVYIL